LGWLPGQSGNPGGRPRARFDLQALARERTAEAIATLARVMRQKTNPAAATRAAEILLGCGWGRVENELPKRYHKFAPALAAAAAIPSDLDGFGRHWTTGRDFGNTHYCWVLDSFYDLDGFSSFQEKGGSTVQRTVRSRSYARSA
jgi:hypothetical protein